MLSKNKNNYFNKILVIFITIIIIISGFYITYIYIKTEEKIRDNNIENFIIDDQVSPLTNQGLVLEVLRIRHRGLLNEIIQKSTKWRQEPVFYFISNIDDQEYISKDIEGAGDVITEDPFEGWDTIFEENKIMRDVAEEQEKSNVTLTLMEIKKSGILGRKTEHIEGDKIQITYDYRTGHWTGDDFLGDNDGYGHFLGDVFELWFNIYQIDFDGDEIPYWTEVNVYGTNPQIDDRYLDQDNDGIPTTWEWKYGYDPNTWDDHKYLDPDVDGIENIEEFKMSKWFSDPFTPDMYIEVDGMERGGVFDPAHVFYDESGQIMIERFAQHNINLYIDNGWPGGPINGGGELVQHIETLSQDAGQILQFYKNNFADERKGIFRYLLIGHNTGFAHPSESNKVDTLTSDTSRLKLIRRLAFTPRTQRIILASATMHELGHSLGLHSWTFPGVDIKLFMEGKDGEKEFEKTYIDYVSVMNYYYIFSKELLDYSNGKNSPPYDQDDWSIIYLPHFQDVDVAIEEPYFYHLDNPEDYIVDENPEPFLEEWEYNIEITQNLSKYLKSCSYYYFKNYESRVYVNMKNRGEINNSNIRIYVNPNIDPTYRTWTLIAEGKLDTENNIKFYSFQEEILNKTQ